MAEQPAINFLGDLQRLTVGPNDRFVLVTPERFSDEAIARLREIWRDFAGEGVKLLVLQQGETLGVIELPAQTAAAAA